MPLSGFHPIISEWFRSRFEHPTEPQQQGWPHIAAGAHALIAVPTGSGKTLTAFLVCLDRLLKRFLEDDSGPEGSDAVKSIVSERLSPGRRPVSAVASLRTV